MAIEIGKGKTNRERNELTKKTKEFLMKHSEELYGEGNDVELELKLVKTRNNSPLASSTMIGTLVDSGSYTAYEKMVKKIRAYVSNEYGLSIFEKFKFRDPYTHEFSGIFFSFEKIRYPIDVRSYLELKGQKGEEYNGAVEFFHETTQQFAEGNGMSIRQWEAAS